MPKPGPFGEELMALGSIANHKLVRVLGSGSYGVVLLADAPTAAEGGGGDGRGANPGGRRTRSTAKAATSAPPSTRRVVIKVARRALGPGADAVWAAHSAEWAALAAVRSQPGAPQAYAAGVLSLPPQHPPPFSTASAPPPQAAPPLPRCHAFMTLEFLGEDLWEHLNRFAPQAWRTRAFPAVAEALLAAVSVPHAAGVVHRDVKPENLCLGGGGGGGGKARVVLVDYGGACVPGRPVRQRDTLFYGTPMYAGCATLRGEAPTPWDDLEALGYCYLEMWLGCLPWSDEFHSLVDNAPGGKWSISNLEAMACVKEADFEAAASAGAVPWFLTAWFDATAAGRAADAAAAAALGKEAAPPPGPGGPVHPTHAAPCLRMFTSLVRAGVSQAEAEASIASLGGGGGGGGRGRGGGPGPAEE